MTDDLCYSCTAFDAAGGGIAAWRRVRCERSQPLIRIGRFRVGDGELATTVAAGALLGLLQLHPDQPSVTVLTRLIKWPRIYDACTP